MAAVWVALRRLPLVMLMARCSSPALLSLPPPLSAVQPRAGTGSPHPLCSPVGRCADQSPVWEYLALWMLGWEQVWEYLALWILGR